MKSAYFDTSVVSKWYVLESDSTSALAARARFRPPAPLTAVHRLELSAAWHAKIHRKEVAPEAISAALDDLEEDVSAGVLSLPRVDLDQVLAKAEKLARRHGAALGARSLDILHVALAIELGEGCFVTADRRQASLASICGLTVSGPPADETPDTPLPNDLGSAIHERFAALGGVEPELPPRGQARDPRRPRRR